MHFFYFASGIKKEKNLITSVKKKVILNIFIILIKSYIYDNNTNWNEIIKIFERKYILQNIPKNSWIDSDNKI